MGAKHFLSRRVIVDGKVHSLSIVSLADGVLTDIKPFSEEIQSVIYIHGILVVVAEAFSIDIESRLPFLIEGSESATVENLRSCICCGNEVFSECLKKPVSLYEIDCSRHEWRRIIV